MVRKSAGRQHALVTTLVRHRGSARRSHARLFMPVESPLLLGYKVRIFGQDSQGEILLLWRGVKNRIPDRVRKPRNRNFPSYLGKSLSDDPLFDLETIFERAFMRIWREKMKVFREERSRGEIF